MSETLATHTDPTYPAYRPHPHLSLLHPVQSVMEMEHAAEDAFVNTAFGVISHLPLPKPHPPGRTLLEKLHVGDVVRFGMAINNLNGQTNGNIKAIALREPGELLMGAGIYVAALAVTEATEFAAHQIHAHGWMPDLPRPDPRHGTFACPDE